jgi:perosamine synthetase
METIRFGRQREWARSSYWMNAIVLADDAGIDAFELGRRLGCMEIETRPFFKGLHEQPVLKSRGLFQQVRLPVTERLHRQGLYLPSGITLSDGQIETVAAGVKAALAA